MNVIHENVMVQLPKKVDTVNGVYMPEEETVNKFEGTVIRFGESVPEAVQMQLASKPKVKYKEYYDGKDITIDGIDYIVMNFKDILIIL
jgi:co-chaperonin GroES (HSP10)